MQSLWKLLNKIAQGAAPLQQTLPEIQVAVALAKPVEIMDPDRVLASTPLSCYDSGTFIMGASDVGDVANIMPTSMLWGSHGR